MKKQSPAEEAQIRREVLEETGIDIDNMSNEEAKKLIKTSSESEALEKKKNRQFKIAVWSVVGVILLVLLIL